MAEKNIYRVVPDTEHRGRVWKLEQAIQSDLAHIIKIFLVKNDAVSYGLDLASKNLPSKMMIHGVDGRLEKEISY